jgi:tRNA (guanine37-N1)-methyltransferase
MDPDAGVEANQPSEPRLRVDVVTLFPPLFDSWLAQGVVSRAIKRGVARVNLVPLRPFGVGRHEITDDYPFGGGPGMVLKPEPLFAAVESLDLPAGVPVILLSPRGRRFSQAVARELAGMERVVMVAGHYEGVDQRVVDALITDELSIGDFVLSSGELAAMVVCDAVIRLLPGALAEGSADDESFSSGLLEYPQYTRPATFRGLEVPAVLLSGNHGEVEKWRRQQSLDLTQTRRPDMVLGQDLTDEPGPK